MNLVLLGVAGIYVQQTVININALNLAEEVG